MVALVIKKDLVEVASYCFTNGIAPKSLKESITTVLYKEGKKDYSLPGSYRPITLKNTLVKVLEKYVANVMSKAVKEHGLLPWNQMGVRHKRSMLSAVGLLNSYI